MHELRSQLLEYLEEVGPYILATPEDADFFRQKKGGTPPAIVPSSPILPKVEPVVPKVEKPAVKIDPVPSVKIVEKKEVAPLPVSPPVDLSGVGRVVSIVAPELPLLKEIPSDAKARKLAERWKTKNQSAPISLLLFQEPVEQRALLEQIAKAIDLYFGPAKTVNGEAIEKEKQWEAFLSVPDLKMIVVCDYTLWQLNGLMHFYKETPAQGTRMLGNVPLFLLPDLSLYLKDPLLKRSLWKALCQKLS